MTEKRKAKYSELLDKLIKRIDRNTRGIAKNYSAKDYLTDSYGDLERDLVAGVFDAAFFQLIQERRNLKVEFENELERLRT